MDDPKTLVSTDWLAAHFKDPDLRILDGTMFMAAEGRNGQAEYDAAQKPYARSSTTFLSDLGRESSAAPRRRRDGRRTHLRVHRSNFAVS